MSYAPIPPAQTYEIPPPPYQENPPQGYGPPGPVPPQYDPTKAPMPGMYPPPGSAPPMYNPQQTYGAVITPPVVAATTTTTQVVVVGGCPACRVGVLEDDFTCLGVCCAIAFFPIGVLCCLAMKQRRCANCGATFG